VRVVLYGRTLSQKAATPAWVETPREATFRRRFGWQPAHRWKAPRVRRISLFFAEARVMRPLVASQARSESPSGCREDGVTHRHRRYGATHIIAAMSRQEVSERIGLGRSSCACLPPGSLQRERSTAEAIDPWPVKPRLAFAACSSREAGVQASVEQRRRSGSQDPGRFPARARGEATRGRA